MNTLIRCAAAGLVSVALITLLKKKVPELSYLMTVAVVLAAAAVFLGLFSNIRAFLDSIAAAAGISAAVTAPVFKAMGIGIVTKLSADLCADAGQNAVASSLELVGAAGALCAALPLMRSVFDMIGSLL